ncbi:hypothetical protein [Bosea sp. AS-1]|uniref:hypothetical protein n=1 Tax=Bosea sp. AS-1 TaxID=2015316 RepID=UPI000B78F3A9|nr:hypothetical protein [Bosea sp. AS-1]
MAGGKNNYQLNGEIVLRDVYRLATMTLADPIVMSFMEKDANEPLYRLRAQYLEDELVHQLLSAAISNRTQIEHMTDHRAAMDGQGFQPAAYECGVLQPDADKNDRGPLSFHEACHKIIHATNIVAQTPEAPETSPMKMELTLRGTKGKLTWVAHLDLLAYLRGSVENFGDFR